MPVNVLLSITLKELAFQQHYKEKESKFSLKFLTIFFAIVVSLACRECQSVLLDLPTISLPSIMKNANMSFFNKIYIYNSNPLFPRNTRGHQEILPDMLIVILLSIYKIGKVGKQSKTLSNMYEIFLKKY